MNRYDEELRSLAEDPIDLASFNEEKIDFNFFFIILILIFIAILCSKN
jgi:hypothetical protein